MAKYIGHARSNNDGKAGDSSGKEVCITEFTYSSSSSSVYNWTYVFRPKKNADVMADMCIKACNNDKIGYCSNGTATYGANAAQHLAKKVNYDLSKITTKTGLSCGDLICLCSRYAGLSTCYIGSAVQLANSFSNNDNYSRYKYSIGMTLRRGDVLITAHSSGKNNHVVMYLGTSKNVSGSSSTPAAAKTVTQTKTTTVSGASAILKSCDAIGWPLGTSKSKWKSPTPALKSWLNKELPNRKWGRYYGASCDKAVYCAIRHSGYDTKVKKNLEDQIKPSNWDRSKWQLVQGGKKSKLDRSKFQPGDVIITDRPGSGGHIYIIYANGGKSNQIIAEGSYSQKNHLHMVKSKGELHQSPGNLGNWHWRPIKTVTSTSGTAQTVTVLDTGITIADKAKELAWPKDSKVNYKYPSGKPTDAFKKALAKYYSISDHKWKPHAKTGASCDVFAGTCIRASGYDKDWPAGLHRALRHAKASKLWKEISYNFNPSKLMPGDIMFSRHKSSDKSAEKSSHIFIYIGNGQIAQASAGHYYGKVFTMSVDSQKKRESWIKVFRATKGTYTTTGGGAASGEYGGTMFGPDNGGPIVLEKETETLYSSNNYKWLYELEKEETEEQREYRESVERFKAALENINIGKSFKNEAPTDVDIQLGTSMKAKSEFEFKLDRMKKAKGTSKLISYPNLVEAPSIELSFNGVVIGGYGNTGDKYPNYITSMSVSKINGRINRYSITLNYQIRAGEDPNFIDKLLSKTGYTNPLRIRYGDSNSPGLTFKEESAIITDVKSSDNVASSSISYTISAISSITSANQTYFTFGEKKGKPSTIINDLLYNMGQVSTQMLTAFPAMADRSFVSSNNLIPNTDKEVTIGGMADVSPLTYLGHVVSCMKNVADVPSSYFLTYNDSTNGAYFNISEVTTTMSNDAVYEIDVGYPGDNFVTDFQLCDNIYWPLIYEYNGNIPKWDYDIGPTGEITKRKTNSLYTDNKFNTSGLINQNWWKSITEFPISAKITIKGLTIPVMLTTYIRINTMFFGEQDIASGLYVVTDQTDTVSGSGYTTTLTLLRVGD